MRDRLSRALFLFRWRVKFSCLVTIYHITETRTYYLLAVLHFADNADQLMQRSAAQAISQAMQADKKIDDGRAIPLSTGKLQVVHERTSNTSWAFRSTTTTR